jgi:hypothetical protein
MKLSISPLWRIFWPQWILSNTIGWVVVTAGLVSTMFVSFYMAVLSISGPSSVSIFGTPDEALDDGLMIGIPIIVIGFITFLGAGVVIGVMQWLPLRQWLNQSGLWILFSFGGWFIGFITCFLVIGIAFFVDSLLPGTLWGIWLALSFIVELGIFGGVFGAIQGITFISRNFERQWDKWDYWLSWILANSLISIAFGIAIIVVIAIGFVSFLAFGNIVEVCQKDWGVQVAVVAIAGSGGLVGGILGGIIGIIYGIMTGSLLISQLQLLQPKR